MAKSLIIANFPCEGGEGPRNHRVTSGLEMGGGVDTIGKRVKRVRIMQGDLQKEKQRCAKAPRN